MGDRAAALIQADKEMKRDRAIKELIDRVQVLTKRVHLLEEKLKKCKPGCCPCQ